MRVLSVVVVPPHLAVSGASTAAERLSSALAERCDVTVASMMPRRGGENSGGASHPNRIPVKTWLPSPLPWNQLPNRYKTLFYRSNISDIIANGNFDLVHIHNPTPALEMARIAATCRNMGVPYVVSTHGFNEIANGRRIYGFGAIRCAIWLCAVEIPIRRVVRNAAAIFALSPADFEIAHAMGYQGAELCEVPNGVVMPAPLASEALDVAVCERLGIAPRGEDQRITCMFLANHTPNKGLPVLLEAFSTLERPFLLIVGGDKRQGVDYEGAIRSCRVGQQIIVTNALRDDDLAAVFRRSDLFVFPTLADTFPLVVLEAMSHGLPVIASRVGGIPYQLHDESGVLTNPGDAAALAAAIEKLAADPGRRRYMGSQARTRAATQFSWNHAADRALAGYERVLCTRKALPAHHTPLNARIA